MERGHFLGDFRLIFLHLLIYNNLISFSSFTLLEFGKDVGSTA